MLYVFDEKHYFENLSFGEIFSKYSPQKFHNFEYILHRFDALSKNYYFLDLSFYELGENKICASFELNFDR